MTNRLSYIGGEGTKPRAYEECKGKILACILLYIRTFCSSSSFYSHLYPTLLKELASSLKAAA